MEQFLTLKEFLMQNEKTDKQILFEGLRHIVASKFSAPEHMTELELKFILNLFRIPESRE